MSVDRTPAMQAVGVGDLRKEFFDSTRAASLDEDFARRTPAELHAWSIEPLIRPRLIAEHAAREPYDVTWIVAMHGLNGNAALREDLSQPHRVKR